MISAKPTFIHRTATTDDVPNIRKHIGLSIEYNMRFFLSDDKIASAKETMP
jgi:hypothetical protein